MAHVAASCMVLMALLAAAPAFTLDAKCSACEAMMGELLTRLEKEVPRNHLDMRHRLDTDGKRSGKVIEYKLSELRMLELLDGLCKQLDAYEYKPPTDIEPEGSWSRHTQPNKSMEQLAQAQLRTKQLVNHCHLFMEQHEDEIIAAVRSEGGAADLKRSVCRVVSSACKAPPAAAAAQPQDEL